MAHLVSTDVFKPGFEGRSPVSEKGTSLKDHTAEDVEFALRLLAYNNTKFSKTSATLEKDYGLLVHPSTLKHWVSSLFVQRYVEIQHELSKEINRKLGSKMVDIAAQATEAQERLVERVTNNIGDISPDKAPQAAASMASVASKNIESGAILEERPTQIIRHENPDAALEMLRSMGLMKTVEAEEVTDVSDDSSGHQEN